MSDQAEAAEVKLSDVSAETAKAASTFEAECISQLLDARHHPLIRL
jgi:hypothetical protein